jgi:UDP-N-acetylmuramoyl-tripeptide--D-alanyl-D-alanine ligase
VQLSRWRGEEIPLPEGGILINDCYNANPLSMTAALEHLAERAGERRRIAVLGDMAELGSGAASYHREIGAVASRVGVDALVAVGPLARAYLEGARGIPVTRWAATVEGGLSALRQVLCPGDCVLVKGSRSMGLEAIGDAVAVVPAAH